MDFSLLSIFSWTPSSANSRATLLSVYNDDGQQVLALNVRKNTVLLHYHLPAEDKKKQTVKFKVDLAPVK
jgi:hypothetical protein